MPIQNHPASIANLAKAHLAALDARNIETPVQTETLRLMLETLVGLLEPMHHAPVADTAKRTVMGHTVAVSEAQRAAS